MISALKGVKLLGPATVIVMDDLKKSHPDMFNKDSGQMDYEKFEKDIRPNYPIQIRLDKGSISFTLEGNEPATADSLIEGAIILIQGGHVEKNNLSVQESQALGSLRSARMKLAESLQAKGNKK